MTPIHRRRPFVMGARAARRPLTVGMILVALTGCARPRPDVAPPAAPAPTIRLELPQSGAHVDMDLERYVAGSVAAEADFRGLAPDDARRLAEIQAILSRTYALANRGRHAHEGFDLCSTTHCQVYRPTDSFPRSVGDLAGAAARATAGLVITHQGHPINAVYHSHCGGGTSDAAVAWGGPTPPYLEGVGDRFCLRETPLPWRFEVSRSALEAALRADPVTDVGGGRLDSLDPSQRDETGRVEMVVIRSGDRRVEVRGEQLRRAVVQRFGVHSLRSTRFSITRLDEQFAFEGQGFGHGVGLCQHGAAARVRAGHGPAAIIAHYYPGTSLRRYH